MLEVHITGWAATAHDKSALTLAQVEASQVAAATEEEGEGEGEGDMADNTSHNDSTTLPMVELYTQLGSQVTSKDYVHTTYACMLAVNYYFHLTCAYTRLRLIFIIIYYSVSLL